MAIANPIAYAHGIPERTKTRWIKEFCDTDLLEQFARGEYRKTTMAAMAISQSLDN